MRTRPKLTSRRPAAAPRQSARRLAFTLLELLLVLAILVVIAGIVMVNIGGAQNDANMGATEAQMLGLKRNIDHYKIKVNGIPETLDELRDGPSDASKQAKWRDPIVEEIPVDAWGNEFQYSKNGNKYEIRSNGIDGQSNTEDDIIVEG